MSIENNNLLLRLHRWASRQDENFTTEAFAHLLIHLIQYEPEIAIGILNKLTNSQFLLDIAQIKLVEVKTQISTEQGKPDIEIRANNFLFFIEVKINSGFGDKQISRYKNELKKSGIANTLLATITRYPYSFYQERPTEQPDINVRWHQIVEWLEAVKPFLEITKLLVNQFIDFLRKRGIAMDKVSWDLVEGIHSFRNLLSMISEALTALKIPMYRASAAWDWYGYYIEDKKLFVGIYLDKPNIVTINTEVGLKQGTIDNTTVGKIDNGHWQNDLDLESEECHFFARTKASQVQCLEKFIQESVSFAKTIV